MPREIYLYFFLSTNSATRHMTHFLFSLESRFCCLYELETLNVFTHEKTSRDVKQLWWMRGFSGWSKLIFSYLEVRNVSLEFISEVSFRLLHSALNYFREFKSLDSGLFFIIQTCSNAFRLLPLFVCKSLWSKCCVWSPKLLSSNCFAVIFHVSPCSEYSLWWVVKIMQFFSVSWVTMFVLLICEVTGCHVDL